MRPIRSALAVAALALAGAATPAAATDVIPARGAPTLGPDNVVPARFTARVTNPWLPLRPGNVSRYRGTKDGRPAVVITRVTDRVRRIMGVPCISVSDRLYLDGVLAEDTVDWYTQDTAGNVWYLGEATAAYERGRVVSRDGSFQAGRNGARGGLFMPADPAVGQEFQQELLPGHAEDRFRIVSLHATARGPFRARGRAIRTIEWSPVEPAVIDEKRYVRGIGPVSENQLRGSGPREALQLVSFRHR